MDWQSIGTAPDDLEEVLVYCAEPRRFGSDGPMIVMTALRGSGGWYASCGGEMLDRGGEYVELVDVYPTHWMRKPLPPV